MEQSAVLCSRHDGLAGITVSDIAARLARLGSSPILSDLGVSDALNREADLLSVTPGREGWRPSVDKTQPAGVLVPLVEHDGGLSLLLTKRTDHLHHHAGQISFPGGRKEDGDPDITATALRETEEEIGLPPAAVQVLGVLPQYVTLTAYAITPVVGVVTQPFAPRPDPFEVADVFEVPLAHVLDPAQHQRHFREENGRRRGYYAIPYGDRLIWGATAGILVNFSRLMASA
ncbi:MAG: CoA pyrophosphatase [Rhodospirillaceae bacterium]